MLENPKKNQWRLNPKKTVRNPALITAIFTAIAEEAIQDLTEANRVSLHNLPSFCIRIGPVGWVLSSIFGNSCGHTAAIGHHWLTARAITVLEHLP